jgi:hypothetical protein
VGALVLPPRTETTHDIFIVQPGVRLALGIYRATARVALTNRTPFISLQTVLGEFIPEAVHFCSDNERFFGAKKPKLRYL